MFHVYPKSYSFFRDEYKKKRKRNGIVVISKENCQQFSIITFSRILTGLNNVQIRKLRLCFRKSIFLVDEYWKSKRLSAKRILKG